MCLPFGYIAAFIACMRTLLFWFVFYTKTYDQYAAFFMCKIKDATKCSFATEKWSPRVDRSKSYGWYDGSTEAAGAK